MKIRKKDFGEKKSMWRKHFVVSKKKSFLTDPLSPNNDDDDDEKAKCEKLELQKIGFKIPLLLIALYSAQLLK